MGSVRMVRPRPLALDERIPVYWPGQEPPLSLQQLDNGELLRHLEREREAHEGRARRSDVRKKVWGRGME